MRGAAILLAVSALALVGCIQQAQTYRELEQIQRDYERDAKAAPAPRGLPAEDTCGAGAFAQLIGQPEREIDRTSLPDTARVVGPDTVVTMDFAPGRLNVMVNAQGVVTELRCA